ncbi:hypothetical protein [Desulfobacter hydrogenophilus]|nr:hypothetical protein [Desulfobacter hydrogenophilus]NDY71446.1 hypothetical protein [Desulfobacter hydrogenophilus]
MKLSTIKKSVAGRLSPWVAELAIRFFPKSNRISRLHDLLLILSEGE